MFGKMMKKDLKRNKMITVILFLFITLSSWLLAGGGTIITEMFSSMNQLFDITKVPHVAQTHTGDINKEEIAAFADDKKEVQDYQIVEMLNIDGSGIYLQDAQQSEAEGVVDISFVTQNADFDYLLDMDNEIAQIKEGYVGVPIYYMEKYSLKAGDTIWIKQGDYENAFIIADFIRDAQMNPSIITSKRFLVNENDWNELKERAGEIEYLIEFLLEDEGQSGAVAKAYENSGLPLQGQSLTSSLYKLTNAITDGLIAAVIFLVSLLLIIIGMLCLKCILNGSIEEDFKEIGSMKALGICNKDIRKMYMLKYGAVAAAGSICGYILSLPTSSIFTRNITLYMGAAEKSMRSFLIPGVLAILVACITIGYCRWILGRFKKISAVEAIRNGSSSDKKVKKKSALKSRKHVELNISLGWKDVIDKMRSYKILFGVFFISSFIGVIPLNLMTTINSPDFVTYMGIGSCDMRIDIRQSEDIDVKLREVLDYLKQDDEIIAYTDFITCNYKVLEADGSYSGIKIETGDFEKFPVDYLEGKEPGAENEIALSSMNADELEKGVGDILTVVINDKNTQLKVTGIYQDITNGGKTAKGIVPQNEENKLWNIINTNVSENIRVDEKVKEYAELFPYIQIASMDVYMSQTLAGIQGQLQLAAVAAIAAALMTAGLITALFIKMTIAKERKQTAIMKSLGFTGKHIKRQYLTRVLSVLAAGIITGTIAANTLGEKIVSAAGSLIGASSIRFSIQPALAYVVWPAAFIIVVVIVTNMNCKELDNRNDFRYLAE